MNERIRAPLDMVSVLRVLIVETLASERGRLVATLADQPGIEVVGDTADVDHAYALAASVLPDVVLLAPSFANGACGRVVSELRAAAPDAHIVVLTRTQEEDALASAFRAGASSYLPRSLDAEFMADALRCTVKRGGLFGHRAPAQMPQVAASPLSPREQQILTLVAEGWTNKQIARELGVAESTVKIHVQHILRKLKIESRVQAAVYAAENGLALKR